MAMIYTAHPTNFGTGFGTRLAVVLTSLPIKFADWNNARKTRDSLHKLSGVQLEDIGLCRADVDRMFGN